MGKLLKNQGGFAALEAVLIVVIVGIIGFAGWFVLNAKDSTDKSLAGNNSTTPSYDKKDSKVTDTKEPAITFKNGATLDTNDKQLILARIVDPMVFYHTNVLKIAIKEVVIDKNSSMMSTADSRFTLNYSYAKEPGSFGFVFGENNKIGYWQPQLCDDGGCIDYPAELKAKYPDTYAAYTECKAARDGGDKQKATELDCM
jgi:hypothetical protein